MARQGDEVPALFAAIARGKEMTRQEVEADALRRIQEANQRIATVEAEMRRCVRRDDNYAALSRLRDEYADDAMRAELDYFNAGGVRR